MLSIPLPGSAADLRDRLAPSEPVSLRGDEAQP